MKLSRFSGVSVVRKLFLIVAAVIVASICVLGSMLPAKAAIATKTVPYTIEGQPYEGFFAMNEGAGDKQPIVVVIHDWNGLDDYEKRRTQMLAENGYAAFAVDLYGQGIRPTTIEASQQESRKLTSDRATMRRRLMASLAQAQSMAGVDPDRVVAIGYCFGGTAALELARSGADLDGFVAFHGGLATPEGQDYSQVKGSVLVLHGADDPGVPMTQVAQLSDAMTQAGVDFDMEIYGGARHAFTVWGADRETARYDLEADLKSWDALMRFLAVELK